MKKNLKYNDNNVCLLPYNDNNNNLCLLPNNKNKNAIEITNNNCITEKIVNITQEYASDNFEFLVHINDIIFTLAFGNNVNNKNIRNIISKIIIIRESSYINLNLLSEALSIMKIEKMNIFSIDFNSSKLNTISVFKANKGSNIIYTEITKEYFINFINLENNDF
jgi:hypothetical protein